MSSFFLSGRVSIILCFQRNEPGFFLRSPRWPEVVPFESLPHWLFDERFEHSASDTYPLPVAGKQMPHKGNTNLSTTKCAHQYSGTVARSQSSQDNSWFCSHWTGGAMRPPFYSFLLSFLLSEHYYYSDKTILRSFLSFFLSSFLFFWTLLLLFRQNHPAKLSFFTYFLPSFFLFSVLFLNIIIIIPTKPSCEASSRPHGGNRLQMGPEKEDHIHQLSRTQLDTIFRRSRFADPFFFLSLFFFFFFKG